MQRRAVAVLVAAALVAATGCGTASHVRPYVSYHEPSQGWTTDVPAGWTAVATGPAFVRGNPLADPTRLYLATVRHRAPQAALTGLAASAGVVLTNRDGSAAGDTLAWRRYRGRVPGRPRLAVEAAVARDGADAEVAALVAPRTELAQLVHTALLPALAGFVPGVAEAPKSILAAAPPDPAYWPTAGWKTASPASQGMDAKRLDAMTAEIRAAKLPVDSVTVVRHGYVVLDESFGRFADGTLPEPYARGRLHELQSATKSVTSIVLGIALQKSAMTVHTPVLRLAAAANYVPQHVDARKRAMTIEDLLTMQSGLAWKETGYPYTPGSGNDAVAMTANGQWLKYTIDRPMATRPGTTFVYNTGAAHLVSGAITVLTRRPAAAFAARRLFAPLGIRRFEWLQSPEGITSGGFGLALAPRDLAKLAFLYLHQGQWDGQQIVPAAWVEQSTTDHVADPRYEYGYLWWLDRADGYAFMAGLYGQIAVVDPAHDLVAVITAHVPPTIDTTAVTRWLLERYILPAAH